MSGKLVLIAIDGSEHSERAFNYYLENVHKKYNKLILLHASEMPSIPRAPSSTISGVMSANINHLMDQEKERLKALEAKYVEELKKNNVTGKVKAMFTYKTGEAIVDEAEEEKVDLVVMGTRGLGKVRRTFLGSVSDYVIHHAKCPVLVCRE